MMLKKFFKKLQMRPLDFALLSLGNAIMAFALVNIHIPAKITEGGGIGLAILGRQLFGVNPALVSFFLDIALYFLSYLLICRTFLFKSILASLNYAGLYALALQVGPVLPSLEEKPLVAAILGGILIGIGCGFVVTRGVAASADDCFAFLLRKKTGLSLSQAYFLSDCAVLIASLLVYLPLWNVIWSLLTTLISSLIVGQFEVRLPQPSFQASERAEAHS